MRLMRTRGLSVRGRIVLMFITIMLLLILVFGTYATYNMYNNIMKNTYKNMNLMIDANSENLNQSFSIITNTTIALSASDAVQEWIKDDSYFDKENERYYLNVQNLNKQFQNILTYNNVWEMNSFAYVTVYENSSLLGYTYTKQVSTKKITDDSRRINELIVGDTGEYINYIPPSPNNNTMYYTRKVKSDFTTDDSLIIIAAINERYLKNKYNGLLSYDGALAYIIDEDGIIYSSNDKSLLGKKISDDITNNIDYHKMDEINYDNNKYVTVSREIKENGFRLIYMLPKMNLIKQTVNGMNSFIIIAIILAIVSIVFVIIISMRTTVFIKDFTTAMNKVREKDYDYRMTKYDDDKLDTLVNTFNSMTSEIQTLLKTTYESKLLLNEMEIKFLQYQMNPHFLFNILLTIQIKAKMCKDETVYQMIASLSALLRAGIYGDKRSIITIEEELKYVEYYLSLQKMRYEDRLTYTINIDEEDIKTCKIPRLVIEPIVENAIVHGVEKTDNQAVVTVDIKSENQKVYIKVMDNGIGFNVEEIMQAKNNDITDRKVEREKMGLKNTDHRLKLIYGPDYGLNIYSEKNVGTTIEIIIPKNKGRAENV
ncbi:hypothetical protein SH1V18_32710 [Vallitalea longa]|uniref:HAMP domain-containing protein n=1 Tax=Vallitalea longa TaxID=2936439 RepID=A0A9W5YDS6_9FIRM|nr:sensor histidine kinase [Vallitalea longa]GKX30791.1 hypothetical protein SH1V18_32710 [Vallitalea longa]